MMHTFLVGVVVVGVSVLLAHLGLHLVRRKVPLTTLQAHHEVAGFIIGVLGAIYAVLLAFVVVVVWNQFEDAKAAVGREANKLNDLARMAEGFPDEPRRRALTALGIYVRNVVEDEWDTMARGEPSPKAQAAMESLWQVYREIDPQTNRESALYAESLDRLNDVSDNRRVRVYASREDVPLVVQILLWGGGVVAVAFTYFFGVKSIRSQSLMTAALAGEIAFILFLIIVLDNPFHGYLRVTPEPMQQVLGKIESVPVN